MLFDRMAAKIDADKITTDLQGDSAPAAAALAPEWKSPQGGNTLPKETRGVLRPIAAAFLAKSFYGARMARFPKLAGYSNT